MSRVRLLAKIGEAVKTVLPDGGSASAPGEVNWRHRRDTAANWASSNPTPLAGALCFETDTRRSKLGDGTTAYNSLLYTDSGLFVATASDQSVTNSTTVVNSALALALEANATYSYEGYLLCDGSNTGDLKLSFTWPSGATGWYEAQGFNATGVVYSTYLVTASATPIALGMFGVGTKVALPFAGFIKTTTAGTLQHQFAQNSTDGANATTLYAASYLTARRRA